MLGWLIFGSVIIYVSSYVGFAIYKTEKAIKKRPIKSKKQIVIERDEFKIDDGNVKEFDGEIYVLTDEEMGFVQEEKTKCTCDKCTCGKKENTKETEKKEEIFVELDRDK